MESRISLMAVVGLAVASLLGCNAPDASPGNTRAEVGGENPACTQDTLDCYWNGQQFVRLDGHRHEPGCGHAWDGQHWVAVVPTTHRHKCTPSCKKDHYCEGKRVITIFYHEHKPGCGHVWDGERWLRIAKPQEDPNHPDYAGNRKQEEPDAPQPAAPEAP